MVLFSSVKAARWLMSSRSSGVFALELIRGGGGGRCRLGRADLHPRVGVLHVIDGVLRVLLDGEIEVKFHLGVGLAHIEEEARGVHRHLVEQVG